MPRDNEKIVELLDEAQKYHKYLLRKLIDADAPPELLRAVVDAMERLSNSLGCDRYNEYPHFVVQPGHRFSITDEIEAAAMKLNSLIAEAQGKEVTERV